jgi:hypothetical protein
MTALPYRNARILSTDLCEGLRAVQLFRGLDTTKPTDDAFKKLVGLSAANIKTGTPEDVLTLVQVRMQTVRHGSSRAIRRYQWQA